MKYALITGGSRGIGKAICLKLASMGYNIIINYQSNHDAAQATAEEVQSHGVLAQLLRFDVSDKTAVNTELDNWIEAHPDDTIDVLINNAGIRRDNIMVFMPDEDWHNVLDTTLNGFFYITRKLYAAYDEAQTRQDSEHRIAVRHQRTAGTGELQRFQGSPHLRHQGIGARSTSRKVTVNAVAPGFISTDMTKGLPEDELKGLVPMRRFGTPEEVAGAVGFLVSEEASYITGEVININGGLYT